MLELYRDGQYGKMWLLFWERGTEGVCVSAGLYDILFLRDSLAVLLWLLWKYNNKYMEAVWGASRKPETPPLILVGRITAQLEMSYLQHSILLTIRKIEALTSVGWNTRLSMRKSPWTKPAVSPEESSTGIWLRNQFTSSNILGFLLDLPSPVETIYCLAHLST